MKRIIVCGCRDWGVVPKNADDVNRHVVANAERSAFAHVLGLAIEDFSATNDVKIVHGACSGADALASEYADSNGLGNEPHLADWARGKIAGPIRNQQIVDLGASLAIAYWDGESRGTADMIKRCVKAGIPVQIVPRKIRT